MKIIPIKLLAAIRSRLTAFSMCWLITRTDGVIQGFTDAQDDLTVDGQLYLAITGFEPTAIESGASMSVDNMELNGLLNSSAIVSADIVDGFYDYAEVKVFQVNRHALEDGVIASKAGSIGQISVEQGKFVTEVRGVMQAYSQSIVEVCSKTCRAVLGDARCKVGLTEHTKQGTVTAILANFSFQDAERTEAEKYFAYGKVKFTTGANAGIRRNVKASNGTTIELALPLPRALEVGDTYEIVAGCDADVDTCQSRFSNVLNFRGEPYVPDPAVTQNPAS